MEVPGTFEQRGVLLEVLIAGGVAGFFLALAILCVYLSKKWEYERYDFLFAAGASATVAAIFVAVALGLAAPFDAKYWHYYTVTGEVTKVTNTLAGDGDDGLTRTPVVEVEGVPFPLVVDDPRVTQLNGARLSLRCTIRWNYQAADEYKCRIKSYEARGSE